MGDAHEELVNVYDEAGRVDGTLPRQEAKASGRPVGAVNVLIVNLDGEVLLQRRPADKENGGRWDKSVGGHVAAGESFDATALREAGEELFGDGGSSQVRLESDSAVRSATRAELSDAVLFHTAGLQLNLRDVRLAADGGVRRVVYHVASYLGRTAIAIAGFRPQADEIAELGYFRPAEVDRLLLAGHLAPNMANLWLARGWALLSLAGLPPAARLRDGET
jgi:8-oxo-dGTP pyrophosphatase MutT (NUDIX family)